MSTIRSLVCWGGRTGKSVTANATTDIFTLTNHGNRNGSKRWFASDIPDGLSYLVPYYTKSLTANTFELYTDEALTTKALFTSSPTAVIKSDWVVTPSVLAAFGVDISRYGDPGDERIYDGFANANSFRSTVGLTIDDEVIEIGEAFDEAGGSVVAGFGFSLSYLFTTSINGIRSPAFHGGIPGAGHTFTTNSAIYTSQINVTIDGLDLLRNSASSGVNSSVVSVAYGGNVLCNSIVRNIGAGYCNGILANGTLARVYNNLVVGVSPGVYTVGGIAVTAGAQVYNNTTTKCGVGFIGTSGGTYGQTYNNLSVGNEINWKAAPPYAATRAAGNIGEIADLKEFSVSAASTLLTFLAPLPVVSNQQVFLSSSGTLPSVSGTPLRTDVSYYIRSVSGNTVTISTAFNGGALPFSDAGSGTHTLSLVWATSQAPENHIDFSDPSLVFVDWANNDFRPAGAVHTPAAQALMVDAGVAIPAADVGVDILGKEKPNYNGGGAEGKDVGAFEFDHGYGPRPASATVTFSGISAGSEIHVYDSEGNEVAGTEACSIDQVLTWSVPANPLVSITIIKRGLRWQKFPYVSTVGSSSIPIFPQPDLGYNNPA